MPVASPTAKPATTAMTMPWSMDKVPANTPEAADTEPTDRSNPPAMIISVIPQATTPMMAFC